jgi:hypothetical protein
MGSLQDEHFNQALLLLLDETFESVHGFFLDRGTSLFETLAEISAEQASIPVGGRCATLAAQVKHVAFYLQVVVKQIRQNSFTRVDWGEIWRTIDQVTPQEWEQIQAELRQAYHDIRDLVNETTEWPSENEIGGAIAVIAHSAYHLGEIRQALCTLKKQQFQI